MVMLRQAVPVFCTFLLLVSLCATVNVTDEKRSTASSNVPVQAGVVRYLGCWLDKGGDKSTEGGRRQEHGTKMELPMCLLRCWDAMFRYAVVKFGMLCFCAHAMTSFTPDVQSYCYISCFFNTRYVCGGINHVSAFHTGYIAPTAITHVTDEDLQLTKLGCYTGWEAMCMGLNFTTRRMSVGLCVTVCEHQLKTLAGIMNGDMCCCGHTTEGLQLQSEKTALICTSQCPIGATTLPCGSNKTSSISLYSIDVVPVKRRPHPFVPEPWMNINIPDDLRKQVKAWHPNQTADNVTEPVAATMQEEIKEREREELHYLEVVLRLIIGIGLVLILITTTYCIKQTTTTSL